MTQHIGFAWRVAPNMRYEGDKREIGLEISAEIAGELLTLLAENPDQVGLTLHELTEVLTSMGVRHADAE